MRIIDVVVGGLLGDEGKGKLVGRIGEHYDAVLRVNASTNAGHCVSNGDQHFVTRQLPSVFYPSKTLLVIAPGALLNLQAFLEELESRPDIELLVGKVKVASSISLVIEPYLEKDRGKIGDILDSTRQGTGPSAAARALRHSPRLFDIAAAAHCKDAHKAVLDKIAFTTRETLPDKFGKDEVALRNYSEEVLKNLIEAFNKIEAIVGDFCVDYATYATTHLVDKEILIEGCNGLLLDNIHGMHPYVTSASTNLGAMLSGANFSHHGVRKVMIVISSYATCLGKRTFPTEMEDTTARHFFHNCNEIDVAEMKKRRIGWMDLPALRKALSGSHGCVLHMNKLDVLTGLDEIKVCTHYLSEGKRIDVLPESPYQHKDLTPQYVTLKGWNKPLQACRSQEDLPQEANEYIQFISKSLSLPVESVGVGPDNQHYVRTA